MLETRLIAMCLSPENKSDETVANILNEQLNSITRRGGELKAYTAILDHTNLAGARFVNILATFWDLYSDTGISGEPDPSQ